MVDPHQFTNDCFHPIIFERITGTLIKSVAMNMYGAAGSSLANAVDWRRSCCCFKKSSDELCDSLASVARKVCTRLVDPKSLSAFKFVAACLIALGKKKKQELDHLV